MSGCRSSKSREQFSAHRWLLPGSLRFNRCPSLYRLHAWLTLALALTIFLTPNSPVQADPVPLAVFSPPPILSAEDAKQVELLKTHWQSQKDAVFSARLKFSRFNWGVGFRPIGPEEVAFIFKPEELAKDPKQLKNVVEQLLVSPLNVDPPWTDFDFYMEGEKVRQEGSSFIHVFDGEDDVLRDGLNSIVFIGQPPGVPYKRPDNDDFRMIPDEHLISMIQRIEGGSIYSRLFIQSDVVGAQRSTWIDVDNANQMVQQTVDIRPNRGLQVLQGGWLPSPNEIQWPGAHGVFVYDGNPPMLKKAKITVTNLCELNTIIDPEKFYVAARSKDRIIDYRGTSPSQVTSYALLKNVKDSTIQVVNQIPAEQKVPIAPKTSRWWYVAGNVLAVIFVMLGVLLRRSNHRKSDVQ